MLRNLAAIRREKGISQKQLAKDAGILPPNLCHYEKCRHEPLVSRAAALANALGCTVDDLVGERGDHAA